MELTINIDKVIKSGLSIEIFITLQLLYFNDIELLGKLKRANMEFYDWYEAHLNILQINDYILVQEDEIVMRPKTQKLFEEVSKINLSEFTNQFRNIFPIGGDSFGRYRGDLGGCKSKLKTFFKENPKITPEEVLEATRRYVKRYENNNWEGMTRAHYFIKKNNVSLLAAEIEALGEEVTDIPNRTTAL